MDKFYDFVEEAKVYTFSNGKIKGVQRNYQKVANDYQIIFDDHAIIKETQDDDNIGFISFHFVELSQLPRHEINSVVDVCGIITEMSAKEELIGRSGEKIVKRVLNLKDHSFHSIELTL